MSASDKSGKPELRVVGEASALQSWQEQGRRLFVNEDRFQRADWSAEGLRDHGAATLRATAGELGRDPGELCRLAKISEAYPPLRRRNTLEFFHYEAVIHLPPEERDRILDNAAEDADRGAEHRWTRARIREEARAASTEAKLRQARAELRQARTELAALRKGGECAGDEAKRVEARVRSALRAAVTAHEDVASVLEGIAALAPAMHGNSRRALPGRVRRDIDRAHGKISELTTGRIQGALSRIAASPAGPEPPA